MNDKKTKSAIQKYISYPVRDTAFSVMKQRGMKTLHRFDSETETAYRTNKNLLRTLLQDNKNTEYGKKYKFSEIRSVAAYRKRVPLTTYDDYETYIERMTEHGERNLLTAYPIAYYASTSGTSGNPKKIPVTKQGLNVFQAYSACTGFAIQKEFYEDTKRKNPVNGGTMLLLLSLKKEPLNDGVNFGSISSACLDDTDPRFLSYLISTPKEVILSTENTDLKYLHARYGLAEKNIAYFVGAYIPALLDLMNYIRDNYENLIRDIREGVLDSSASIPDDIRKALSEKLTPDPKRADELEAAFAKGVDEGLMRRIWPKLSWISAIWAGNFSSYARKLQEYSGRSIPYYTMTYVSSEGVFGIARHPYDQCYALIPGSCFFEFIPMDGKNGENETENPQTLLLNEVEEGKEYELVITNQSGFYRYRMGDVIKVIGFYNETPLVVFKYRKKNIVSIAGEKFTEDHLLSAIREFERRTDINIVDFCMYPDRDAEPGRYVIMLEPEKKVPAERYDECRDILAQELARASTSYAHYVEGGNMGIPKLIFLQSQTFQLYREMKMYKTGLTDNQLKTVRVLTTPELIRFFTGLAEN